MRLIFAAEERQRANVFALLEEMVRQYREQNADLLATVLSLKSSGAAVPVAPVKRPADRVLEVIADVAGSNAPLRSMLGRYARQERAKRVDDDTIIKVLMHWPDADDDDSSTDDMTT